MEVHMVDNAVTIMAIILLILIILFLLSWIFMMIWVYNDAKRRRVGEVGLWVVVVLIGHFIGLIIYLVVRGKDKIECPSCGKYIEKSYLACPFCGTNVQISCPSCQQYIGMNFVACPFCGKSRKNG